MTSDFVIKSSHLQEAEFILLEVMDCCLVIYQPYRPLVQLINVSQLCKLTVPCLPLILGYESSKCKGRRCTVPGCMESL